jgi:hypothetical protein
MVMYQCIVCKPGCTICINNGGELKHPRSCISKKKQAKAHFVVNE